MKSKYMPALFAGCAILAVSAAAVAQNPPPPGPLYDPQQLPIERGQVQQFTLTPRGDIDGFILADDTEVKTPPRLSTDIAYSIKSGDTVVIHGLHAAVLPLVQAVSIADEATGRTVVDNGPPGPRRVPGIGPIGPAAGLTEVQGRVRMPLHGPRGDINGALLEDGTILRLPPPEAERFSTLLQTGQAITAEGAPLTSPIGKVVEVHRLGASRDQLNQVQAPPGPGPGRKKDRRGPPPA